MTPALRIHGVVPPVPTPLTATGAVDAAAFQRIFDHLVAGGAHAAFVLGSTGELASLPSGHRGEVIREAVAASAGRIPVLVGIADNCPATSVDLGRLALDLGADAVVAAAPSYYELSSDELQRHFDHLLPQLELPVLLYNMPWLTGHVLDEACLQSALGHPNLIGFKDSSGDLAYLQSMIEIASVRPEVTVLVGNEYLYLSALKLGAHGVVGGGGNIYPSLFRSLQDAFEEGDLDTARAAQARISRLADETYDLTGRPTSVFVTIKAAMAGLGLCEPHMAPPLTPCSADQMDALRLVLAGSDARMPAFPIFAVA
ncbi:dihydrodipicolinate synthase family protein [Luteolibacter arcticus]|uniref:Dihydrodipicolinate synthase family protein n=1 Tax=Luteolibacter arcticus TaxID=1581411 RepID=A0ABT3GIQ3_9BACT|nr:dihydrodipicolinate synthase family protein [Luteolibacter arcticus]MCW1923408.1 dihydrodipicolinate synthase family protein [Luteolibacter arcticus]